MTDDISFSTKLRALLRVVRYRPGLVAGLVSLSVFAAILEGIGLSFIIPIIDVAQGSGEAAGGPVVVFVHAYELLGIPFSLEYIILGVGVVMAARYTSSFMVAWLVTILQTDYVRDLQSQAFDHALDAEIEYFDERGSDDILNTIVTQSRFAGQAISRVVEIVEQSVISLIYVVIALAIAPMFTIVSGIVLGVFLFGFRSRLESAYSVGDRVATANQSVQTSVQAGMQGIRDVKLFGMRDELFADFQSSINKFRDATIRLRRNEAALDHFYQLVAALTVFGLIYFALRLSSLTLATLGLFLFAMFRLAPRISALNNSIYQAEGDLPHLVRTQRFLDELEDRVESQGGTTPVPSPVEIVAFQDVSFGYERGEEVLNGVSFSIERGEFAAFVGPSGMGKSTIVSLLTRLYDPDSGQIVADGIPVDEFPLNEWRDRISVVRQNPHIFNDSLQYNLTVGNRNADLSEIERVCEIAQVMEFLHDLPNGYETVLGDDGIRLSGGQRQRVAIARALLEDSDLLVLDEATSDLDTGLEEQVHRAVEEADKDYAILVIAHRLSTVVNADQIYVIEEGQIVASGKHQELLSVDDTYAKLFSTR